MLVLLLDYINEHHNVIFGPGLPLRQCYTFQIVRDIAFEGDEMFQIFLGGNTKNTERLRVTGTTVNVTILDYNGEQVAQ